MAVIHTQPAIWPTRRPGRFVDNVRDDAQGCKVALLGLPDDTGVRLNFGRAGAQDGPTAFRAALSSFGASFDALRQQRLETLVFDAGDVLPAPGDDEAALFETHRRVEAAAHAYRGLLERESCRVLGERKHFSKGNVSLVFRAPYRVERDRLDHVLTTEIPADLRGAVDWEME